MKMVIRPKHVAVIQKNIQNSVALDGNSEPDKGSRLKIKTNFLIKLHLHSEHSSTTTKQNFKLFKL
jgi:hypothetical protein